MAHGGPRVSEAGGYRPYGQAGLDRPDHCCVVRTVECDREGVWLHLPGV